MPINVLKRVVEPRQISIALDIQLTRLVANLNLKWSLNDHQIKTIVEDLIDTYPAESLDDFILCFKKARQGAYGELIRLDGPIIFSWMGDYLDEKYRIIEDNLMHEKDQFYKTVIPENSERDWLAEWQKETSAEGMRAVPKLSEKEIEEEGQEKPKRVVYPFNGTEAEIKLREVKAKIRECQARGIRERHPQWTEEQIEQRVKELDEYATAKETEPKLSYEVDKIMNPKKKNRKSA